MFDMSSAEKTRANVSNFETYATQSCSLDLNIWQNRHVFKSNKLRDEFMLASHQKSLRHKNVPVQVNTKV